MVVEPSAIIADFIETEDFILGSIRYGLCTEQEGINAMSLNVSKTFQKLAQIGVSTESAAEMIQEARNTPWEVKEYGYMGRSVN